MNKGHSTTETFIRFIVTLVIGVIAIICLIKILDYGIVGVEEQYCYKLQAQAEQYKNFTLSKNNPGGFYITQADKTMCDMYNINIKAVVK
jgi:uncharacterized membrane protein (Fun14 family)